MQRPIFLLVSGDGLRLDALRDDLSRRYQADYQVTVAGSAAAALTTLAVPTGDIAQRLVDRVLHELDEPSDEPGELIMPELVLGASASLPER